MVSDIINFEKKLQNVIVNLLPPPAYIAVYILLQVQSVRSIINNII